MIINFIKWLFEYDSKQDILINDEEKCKHMFSKIGEYYTYCLKCDKSWTLQNEKYIHACP